MVASSSTIRIVCSAMTSPLAALGLPGGRGLKYAPARILTPQQRLRYLYGIKGRALAQLIRHDPQLQPMRDAVIGAQTADVAVVAPLQKRRHRVGARGAP